MTILWKNLITVGTFEGFITSVCTYMSLKMAFLISLIRTVWTKIFLVPLLCWEFTGWCFTSVCVFTTSYDLQVRKEAPFSFLNLIETIYIRLKIIKKINEWLITSEYHTCDIFVKADLDIKTLNRPSKKANICFS